MTENDFDLSRFLKFEVIPGGEDSAEPERLLFNVTSKGVYKDLLTFLISFEDPEAVSIGKQADILVMEVINPTFFSSAGSGHTIPAGHRIDMKLPKMLRSNIFAAIIDLAA